MYTKEQYDRALARYDECGSVTKTITQLGYPARRQTLYNWITRRKHLPPERSTFCGVNTPEHPRHPALELKLEVLHRCFEMGETVQSVSDEIGYSTASIDQWRRKFIHEGRVALMKPTNERGKITATLQREGLSLSEKVVRYSLRENPFIVKCRKMRKYNSNPGEINLAVTNVVARNFKAKKQPEVAY